MRLYMMDSKKQLVLLDPVSESDMALWMAFFGRPENRRVDLDELVIDGQAVRVSTVFLGIDHSYRGQERSEPMVFETMVFGGRHDEHQTRWSSYAEAKQGHAETVAAVKAFMPMEKR